MSYQSFAYLYDSLMDEAPYEEWMDYFLRMKSKYHPNGNKVLDLACGTGSMTIRLAKAGIDVTGVDLSEDMLAVAHEKLTSEGYQIPLFHQDMTDLNEIGKFDIAIIFCDSLNYLKNEEDVQKTFQSIYDVLNQDGLLLFDVHSTYKTDYVYPDQTFAYDGDEIAYIWNSFSDDLPHSVIHELTFFVLDETTNQYERIEETHYQRTFSIEQYENWLKMAGFTVLEIKEDFGRYPVSPNSERIFFAAKKD